MDYHCLIAGLPEIEIDAGKFVCSIADFRAEVRPQLSASDTRLIDLFYMKFDNRNLLRYLRDREAQFDLRGNISRDELEECLRLIGEDDDPANRLFPVYFKTFVAEYRDVQHIDTEAAKWENRLTELYYRWAMECDNVLISRWFEFNINLNNILVACTGRKYQLNVEVVGDNEVAESIRTSNQRDFGLTGIVDDLEVFQRLADEPDWFERERKIDLLKWQWLDEQTFFKYFTVERVFAFLVKLEIVERWTSLSPEGGGKIFRNLIDNLKESVTGKRESINL